MQTQQNMILAEILSKYLEAALFTNEGKEGFCIAWQKVCVLTFYFMMEAPSLSLPCILYDYDLIFTIFASFILWLNFSFIATI